MACYCTNSYGYPQYSHQPFPHSFEPHVAAKHCSPSMWGLSVCVERQGLSGGKIGLVYNNEVVASANLVMGQPVDLKVAKGPLSLELKTNPTLVGTGLCLKNTYGKICGLGYCKDHKFNDLCTS